MWITVLKSVECMVICSTQCLDEDENNIASSYLLTMNIRQFEAAKHSKSIQILPQFTCGMDGGLFQI